MAMNERRLTGRDVLAKTFQAKTKRGYDPVEVDAYLELVAAQIDMLHGDVSRAGEGAAAAPAEVDEGAAGERDALTEQVTTLTAERDALQAQVAELAAANEAMTTQQQALRAENDQLKTQLTSVAPPPPGAPAPAAAAPAPPVAAPAPPVVSEETAVETTGDDRASEESFELVLRMARRSAEETIAEAHSRADEIVADANFTAAQISRESDRKAFEAANKVQAELAAVSEQIDTRKAELRHLDGRAAEKRVEMRELANKILALAGDTPRPLEGAEVVDLRTSSTENA